jgi:hypothetical protein
LFDIPAQPLTSALDAYSVATGFAVIYDGDLAANRQSTAIKGLQKPDAALRSLLGGTQLTVHYAGQSAFAIVPASERTNPSPAVSPGYASYQTYFAALQFAIGQAFCRNVETRPGRYRVALKFWIDPFGTLVNPTLLSSTGHLDRDAMISSLLKDLVIDRAPPPTLPQPIAMIIEPRPPETTGDCSGS